MLVSASNFDEVINILSRERTLAIDTETTGLRPYHGDRLFSVIIANATDTFYFNFHEAHPEYLTKLHLALLHTELFSDMEKTWIVQNAKFDMAILSRDGCEILGTIYDTKAIARVLKNDRLSLDLDSLAADIGCRKSDAVKEYILENGFWEWFKVPGKNRKTKIMYFNKVPFEIIQPYAELDARLTYDIHTHQQAELERIQKDDWLDTWPPISDVVKNEVALTKALFDMEKHGVLIDRDFCERAIDHEASRMGMACYYFKEATGLDFKNSGKLFAKVFEGEKFYYGKMTEKKKQINPKFDYDVLCTFKSPVAKHVLEWRDAKSKLDFYHGFVYQADKDGVIHCNFNQDGTVTGRLSSSEPNLQNLTKPEEGEEVHEFSIRRAIIPRPGKCFVMFDYEQMEYRLLLDYIGAKDLIEKVQAGFDVHEATAQIVGIKRSQAKTVNFGLIYGQGSQLLAKNLGVSVEAADSIKATVLNAIPELADFIERVQAKATKRGMVFNWFGRRCLFPDARFAYRAVNHMIQGGCADVAKIAMVRVHNFLKWRQTKMVLTVHDEIVLEVLPQDYGILPEIKIIMENVYVPKNGIKLTCGVDHSFKSLADKVEGFPT